MTMTAATAWEPGDPLIGVRDRDCIRRPIFQIIDDGGDELLHGGSLTSRLACVRCQVSWDRNADGHTCWNCGEQGLSWLSYRLAMEDNSKEGTK
jgi:hypothetical protein